MKYPTVEVNDPFLGPVYREMSPEEYEDKIEWYRNYIERLEHDSAPRRLKEYASYLRRWFGESSCDGLPNFKIRYTLHTLPMSFNVYFYG